jgi:hypothetical protein
MGLELFSLGIGFVGALVLIQFYPKAAMIGKWIVTKGSQVKTKIQE